jgi:cyanophycinase-like exopeptidase
MNLSKIGQAINSYFINQAISVIQQEGLMIIDREFSIYTRSGKALLEYLIKRHDGRVLHVEDKGVTKQYRILFRRADGREFEEVIKKLRLFF